MRPIKFRAWYKNEKLMLPIAEITFHKDWDIIAFPLTRVAISSYLVWGNAVLMKSTWLKDKNGQEIYEGDIVQSTRPAAMKYKVIRDDEVAWFIFEDEFKAWFSPYRRRDVVIIGNIYENSELLND